MNKWVYIIIIIGICGAIGKYSCNKENSPQEYIEAVNDNDFEKAHDILDNLYADYLKYPNDKSCTQSYWTAADYIYKAEMQWLLPQNNPEADKRLIFTLDAMNPPGVEPRANYTYGLSEYNKSYKNFNAYCSFVEQFNKLCLELISLSLRNDNMPLAQMALNSIKVRYTSSNYDDTYTYEPDDGDIIRAKDMINKYKTDSI